MLSLDEPVSDFGVINKCRQGTECPRKNGFTPMPKSFAKDKVSRTNDCRHQRRHFQKVKHTPLHRLLTVTQNILAGDYIEMLKNFRNSIFRISQIARATRTYAISPQSIVTTFPLSALLVSY